MTRKFVQRALAPLSLIVLGGSVLAQQSVIDHCKQTSSDADRIACLEAALLGKEIQTEPETQAQIDPPSMEIDAGPADTGTGAATVATTSATAAVVETEAAVEAQPDGIGAEQVVSRTQSIDEREASLQQERGLKIAKYEWVPYERLVVTFENGQVWRQIKGDVNRIRTSLERNQTADITESGLGGYQLRLNEIRRTIRVERIR